MTLLADTVTPGVSVANWVKSRVRLGSRSTSSVRTTRVKAFDSVWTTGTSAVTSTVSLSPPSFSLKSSDDGLADLQLLRALHDRDEGLEFGPHVVEHPAAGPARYSARRCR